MLDLLATELESKRFQEQSDQAVVRGLVRSFLLKHMFVRAICQRDIGMLSSALSLEGVGELLDQPVDHALNTPLHTAIAHRFREGAPYWLFKIYVFFDRPEIVNFGGLGGRNRPLDPLRSTGRPPDINLHQKSAPDPETN